MLRHGRAATLLPAGSHILGGVRRAVVLLSLASVEVLVGCGRDRQAPGAGPPVTIEVDCGDDKRTLEVQDRVLDDALCDEPWTAWQIDSRRTMELVRQVPGRTVWLRRRGADAVVEVREGDRVASTFVGVTRLRLYQPPTRREPDWIPRPPARPSST